jgi:hypothetical protein
VPSAWDAETLVDRERLLQVAGGLAGFAVLEVAAADSFQGAHFELLLAPAWPARVANTSWLWAALR